MTRALVADDDAINREIAQRMLSRLGLEVQTVASGDAALEAVLKARAEGWTYGLVFLDISMPGLDGYEVSRRIRALGLDSRLLAFSGRDSSGEAIKAGFDVFLQKPLTMDRLKSALSLLV